MTRLALALALGLLMLPSVAMAEECIGPVRITGYVRGHDSPWTADGTSVWSRENIAAAGYSVPMGAVIDVDGIGTYIVRDRGGLGAYNIDILVDTVAEAYAITSYRMVCIR